MRRTDEILQDIIARPGEIALRLEYADACEAKDPERADYIRRMIRVAPHVTSIDNIERIEQRIAQPIAHLVKWSEMLLGFVARVTIDPHEFLERADEIYRLAPVRHVLLRPRQADRGSQIPAITVPSPIPELFASRSLAHLQSLSFGDWMNVVIKVNETDLEALLACQHLDNMLFLDLPNWPWNLKNYPEPERFWRRLYAKPQVRKMLHVSVPLPGFPGEREVRTVDSMEDRYETAPMPALGRELEQQYGYIPSLHALDSSDRWDQGTYIYDRGELPRFPVGTPVTEAMYERPKTRIY